MELPDLTFGESVSLHLGPSPVELRFFGRAHTRGDVVVSLPDRGVLFAGDLSFHGYIPSMQDSYPSHWVATMDRLLEDQLPVVVPGHGPVGTPEDLRQMRACLNQIIEGGRRGFAAGWSPAETLRELSMGPFASWPRQTDRLPPAMERIYRELRGDLD